MITWQPVAKPSQGNPPIEPHLPKHSNTDFLTILRGSTILLNFG
jgi:hypothetical protein